MSVLLHALHADAQPATGGGAGEAEQSHICGMRGIGTGALRFLYAILYGSRHCLVIQILISLQANFEKPVLHSNISEVTLL